MHWNYEFLPLSSRLEKKKNYPQILSSQEPSINSLRRTLNFQVHRSISISFKSASAAGRWQPRVETSPKVYCSCPAYQHFSLRLFPPPAPPPQSSSSSSYSEATFHFPRYLSLSLLWILWTIRREGTHSDQTSCLHPCPILLSYFTHFSMLQFLHL